MSMGHGLQPSWMHLSQHRMLELQPDPEFARHLQIWQAHTGQLVAQLTPREVFGSLWHDDERRGSGWGTWHAAWSSHGRLVALWNTKHGGRVAVLDEASWERVALLELPVDKLCTLVWNAAGTLLVWEGEKHLP